MLALILIKDRPRLGPVALVMATALALSTLTTKQHFIADVLVRLRARVLRPLVRAAQAAGRRSSRRS